MADKNEAYDSVTGLHDRAGHLARRLQQTAVAHFTRCNGSFGVTSVQYAVLIAVRDEYIPAWDMFHEGMATWLPADTNAVLDWYRTTVAKPYTEAPAA